MGGYLVEFWNTDKLRSLRQSKNRQKNLEESKMCDRDRIENELKTNLKRIKVQREKGNKSPKRKEK